MSGNGSPRIDTGRIRRHIETLAGFTATPGAGSTRLSYSDEYRGACDYLAAFARDHGLSARLDAIGNLRIALAGREPDAAAVVVGSHLDTVIHGGDFDGILGVVAGVEVLATMAERGIEPRRPVEVVSFIEEEGTTFRCPLTGSKALTGWLDADSLFALKDESGRTLREAAEQFGLAPERLGEDRFVAGRVHCMLELHIEQGAVLESLGVPVGVVSHIAGSENHRVRLAGRANHAGTTPMHLRYDALACAAECMKAIESVAAEDARPDTVATVGRIHCKPNAVNVIPAFVEFSIDVRDVDAARITSASNAIFDAIGSIARRRGIEVDHELTGESAPTPMSPALVDRLETLAAGAGIPCHRMNSGALHDAAMMARICDTAMIFVPSAQGRSHSPREWTEYRDIEQGAALLLAAVLDQSGARSAVGNVPPAWRGK